MKMSTSTYYYRSVKSEEKDLALRQEIEKVIELLPDSGYRPVTAKLRESKRINGKRVLRVMGKYNLLCRKHRKFKVKTTQSNHRLRKYANILKEAEIDAPRQALVGDVTAFDIQGRDHYLALLMDVFTRETLGMAVSDKNDTPLVLACLNDAAESHPDICGALHHTDADVRYCSALYVARAAELRLTMSMTVGNVYENAHAESLNKTYKRQEINVSDYGDKFTAAESLFRFKSVYNTQRPHSSIGMLPPSVFRKKFERKRTERNLQA
jgi:transposase InsO family protein